MCSRRGYWRIHPDVAYGGSKAPQIDTVVTFRSRIEAISLQHCCFVVKREKHERNFWMFSLTSLPAPASRLAFLYTRQPPAGCLDTSLLNLT